MNAPLAPLAPEHEQLIVAFLDLDPIGKNPGAPCRARARPGPMALLLDLVHFERDVQLDGVEDLLVPGPYSVTADQRQRMLGYEDWLTAVELENPLQVVAVQLRPAARSARPFAVGPKDY